MDFFDEAEMSVKDWLITFVILLIPIVDIVFLVLWAFSDVSYKRARKNWAIATLIILGVALVVYIVATMIYLVVR